MKFIIVESCVANRMYSYFLEFYGNKIQEIKIYDKRFLIIGTENIHSLFEDLLKDEILSRYINRIFLLEKKTNDLKEILSISKSYSPLRVQAYPKKNLQEEILKMLEGKVELSPTKFEYILYVFKKEDYLYGIFPKNYFLEGKI